MGEMIGQTIKAIRPQTDAERDDEYWEDPAVVIELDNGVLIYPSRDSEGNGPGTLFVKDGEETTLLT